MRGNPAMHAMIAPGTLDGVLTLLAREPGEWTPIAGGTELMVAHAAGRLSAPKLVSLWGVDELRFVRAADDEISIGAGATFQDLRRSEVIARELPLLARAAGWIGSIANQSRATIGGNLVNGSPAADSSPALLVYDATMEMISTRGSRRVPYEAFHTGYKQNILAKDELLYAVHLAPRFSAHRQYLRKVGTRRAMAISKTAFAATCLLRDGAIEQMRVAAASLAPYPARLKATEAFLAGKKATSDVVKAARIALMNEVQPIDDIRSTAEYRKHVAANLLEEFLTGLEAEAAR